LQGFHATTQEDERARGNDRSRPAARLAGQALTQRAAFGLDVCTVTPYITGVRIRSVQHRGLLRLIEDDDSRELRPDLAKRLRNILAALIVADGMTQVVGPPGWRVHRLKGDRAGTWSISVSGNWRLTFDVEGGGDICNLDLEDYH
jgi:proteic killer suppression protein